MRIMRRGYSYENYKRAMELLNMGLGPTEVSRELDIPKSTVKGWIYEYKIPWLARWSPEPSKELAYVLGVLYGDGNLHLRRYCYDIELMVKDYEFAEVFSRAVAKVLNKKYRKPIWSKSHNRWRIYYSSKAFHQWFRKQSLDTLKQYIEHNRETVKYFLRGLYDSDGNNYRCKLIFLYNNDLKLLKHYPVSTEKVFRY